LATRNERGARHKFYLKLSELLMIRINLEVLNFLIFKDQV